MFFFLLVIIFCILLAEYIPTLLQFPLYPVHLEVVMHLIVSKKKNSNKNSVMPFSSWSLHNSIFLYIRARETGDHLNHFPRREWIRFCDHNLGPVVTRLPDKPRTWRRVARRKPGICDRWASNQRCSNQSETRTCYYRWDKITQCECFFVIQVGDIPIIYYW